jgi:hypothetical protein
MKYPITYEEWCKLPRTIKAMKIIMKDWDNSKQLKLEL